MSRNLVICCDGTNNSLTGPPTNVRHIRDVARIAEPELQRVYYDAGVGVEASPGMRTRIGETLSRWSGSAFGTGLVENVQQAYEDLVDQFKTDDHVYLFGFSRGAYTVRVIAGLLQNYGLLKPEYKNQSSNVVKAFRDLYRGDPAAQRSRYAYANETLHHRSLPCPIHFMGVFDTVSSLGWAWDPDTFPNTRRMPNVSIVRHALALDERRAKFRTNRVELTPEADHQQMWFAGVHSDVGGGYAAPKHQLSRVPLRWMLREARAAGLQVDQAAFDSLRLDETWQQDEQAPQNESLGAAWQALEYLPLPHRAQNENKEWIEGRRMYRGAGWRDIPDTFDAHDSLQRRKIPVKNAHWAGALPGINYRQ
jgi:uncharacterized protein (DUF2235 family)